MTSLQLKQVRKQLGPWTQAQLAEKLTVSANTVARWESCAGKFPIPKWVAMILALWLDQQQGKP